MTWPRSAPDEAVSPVIGTILMVAITVVLSTVVFLVVQQFGSDPKQAPAPTFGEDEGADTLLVLSGDEVDWESLDVSGCDTTGLSGPLQAGDEMDCAGDVLIVHRPSNSLLYQGEFQ